MSFHHLDEQFFKMSSFSETCVLLFGCPVSAVSPISSDPLEPCGLVSPSSTVRSLTKELQHSLDLASATSGDKVVTAQVSKAGAHPECLKNEISYSVAVCSLSV